MFYVSLLVLYPPLSTDSSLCRLTVSATEKQEVLKGDKHSTAFWPLCRSPSFSSTFSTIATCKSALETPENGFPLCYVRLHRLLHCTSELHGNEQTVFNSLMAWGGPSVAKVCALPDCLKEMLLPRVKTKIVQVVSQSVHVCVMLGCNIANLSAVDFTVLLPEKKSNSTASSLCMAPSLLLPCSIGSETFKSVWRKMLSGVCYAGLL